MEGTFDGSAPYIPPSINIEVAVSPAPFGVAISVCQGEKIPRKGGPAIARSDLLVINKTDLAPHVGADLSVMKADAEQVRGIRPFVFTDLLRRIGVDEVMRFIEQAGGLKAGECKTLRMCL